MKTTVFLNNRTQAVRIPKEIAFPEDVTKVYANRIGNAIVLTPVDDPWSHFFDSLSDCPEFPDREQPEHQERDWGDLTE